MKLRWWLRWGANETSLMRPRWRRLEIVCEQTVLTLALSDPSLIPSGTRIVINSVPGSFTARHRFTP